MALFDPKKIQENKQFALNKTVDALSSLDDVEFSTSSAGNNAFSNFGNQIKVLANEFETSDMLATGLSNSFNEIKSKFDFNTDVLDVFPPSLNKFADGLGAFARNPEEYISNILPGAVSSITDGINKAVANLENSLVGGPQSYITPIREVGSLLSESQQTSQVGRTAREEVYPKGPGVTLKNSLEAYHSYNCIFTLGVLSARSVNDPAETYRRNGADYTILRSGGGGIDGKRIQTAYDALGKEAGNLEYFIDDFEMQSIIAPTKQNGAAQAINFSFSVHEPYSMGLFLNMLQSAALTAGFQNYLQAPYMLEIDFVGWNDNGEPEAIPFSNRKLPFKLTKIDFDVEKGGSKYNVECIPWNESGLTDEIANIQDSIEITGRNVFECLSGGAQSLIQGINEKLQTVAESSGLPSSNFYMIRFPTQRSNNNSPNATPTVSDNGATLNEAEQVASRLGIQQEGIANNLTLFFNSIGIDENSSNLFGSLRSSAVSDVNSIGAANMLENVNAKGDSPFGLGLYTYDADNDVYKRGSVELTISGENRTFKFQQNTPITKVIEEIILVSTYGQTALGKVNEEGNIPWFKVEPKVYIIEDPTHENITGTTAKIFVYDVVRYDVNVSQFSAPNKVTKGNVALAKQAVKSYNYIYSGKNSDVLGFEIKFNAAFFEAIRADMNQLGSAQVNLSKDASVQEAPPSVRTIDTTTSGQLPESQTAAVTDTGSGTNNFNNTAAVNLARNFHNTLLNSNVDLITGELEIWGDPYFIPDSGVGNYTAAQGPTINITADGSIDHQRSEVDIILNFRTPIDYSTNTGLMEFPGDTIPVDSFSGLYKVLTVTTSISGNKFTQTLKLLRRKNQSTEGISSTTVVTENPQARSLNTVNERPLSEIFGDDLSERPQIDRSAPIRAPIGDNGELVTIRTKSGKTTQVAKIVADQFQALIDELEESYGYEIRTLGGYANRSAIGTSRPSYHASGLAIDINAAENAYVKPRPNPKPNNEPTDMPEAGTGNLMVELAEKHGLGWGGDWNSSIDAMHFSAAKAEGGSLVWPRNGLVPKAPEQTEQERMLAEQNEGLYDDAIMRQARAQGTPTNPPQAQTNTNTSTSSTVIPVEPRNSLPPPEHARWDALYGATHNPDGTPKTAAEQTEVSRSTVSGTQPVTRSSTTTQNGYVSDNSNIFRPYFPTNTNDDLYTFNRGEKIKALARFYSPNYQSTTTPPAASTTFYNDSGDSYTQSDADRVEDLRAFNEDIGGGPASTRLTAGERAYAISKGYI
jgi:hypothetical protein